MSQAHQFIDAQGESRRLLVALDGRVKFVLMLMALGLNLWGARLSVSLALLAAGFLCSLLSGVRLRSFGKRMLMPLVLAGVALLTQFFWVRDGALLAQLDLWGWELLLMEGGLHKGLLLASRILGGMGVILFFSLTTPLPELMRAARFFRCPEVLVELTLIMYRYIFLFMEEGIRIRNAQKARLGYSGWKNALRSSGVLGGMLVLRTFDRAERSFAAMRCRGYRGSLAAVAPGPMAKKDWWALGIGTLLLGLIASLGS